MKHPIALLVPAMCGSFAACAQPLTIAARSTINIPVTATDQNGVSFTVTGVSGVAYAGAAQEAHDFLAVLDNSRYVIRLRLTFDDAAQVTSSSLVSGLKLSESRDFEGIAISATEPGRFILSEEGSPALHVFDSSTGAKVRTITPPSLFTNRRANFGFESACAGPGLGLGLGSIITANEEALTIDGPLSTQTVGTVVRLLRATERPGRGPTFVQHAYRCEPWHGGQISNARSGLCDLVCLPDGRIIALERSFAVANPLFLTRIFELGFAGATEVSGFTNGLVGQTYTPVTKAILYTGSHANLEGLCLGPEVAPGRHALLGVVDDGDPVSLNQAVSFALEGEIELNAIKVER